MFVIIPLFCFIFWDMVNNLQAEKPNKMICDKQVILINWSENNNCGYKIIYINSKTYYINYNIWLQYQKLIKINISS